MAELLERVTDGVTQKATEKVESCRDMALLGLVHRTVLERGPAHFKKWFFAAGWPKHWHGKYTQPMCLLKNACCSTSVAGLPKRPRIIPAIISISEAMLSSGS